MTIRETKPGAEWAVQCDIDGCQLEISGPTRADALSNASLLGYQSLLRNLHVCDSCQKSTQARTLARQISARGVTAANQVAAATPATKFSDRLGATVPDVTTTREAAQNLLKQARAELGALANERTKPRALDRKQVQDTIALMDAMLSKVQSKGGNA